MNWNRAINLLIVVFLIMNLVLYGYGKKYEQNKYNLSEARVTKLNQVLNKKNISLYNYIPPNYPLRGLAMKPPALEIEAVVERIFKQQEYSLEEDEVRGNRYFNEKQSLTFYTGKRKGYIYYNGKQSAYVPKNMTVEEVEKIALQMGRDLLGDNVTLAVTYKENLKDNSYRVEINEIYDKKINFQTFIQLVIKETGIEQALAVRYKPIDFVGKEKFVFPIDEILYRLTDYLEKEEILKANPEQNNVKTIRDIDIGYYVVDVEQQAISYDADPYYRIIFDGGDTYYVNAYTNTVFTPK